MAGGSDFGLATGVMLMGLRLGILCWTAGGEGSKINSPDSNLALTGQYVWMAFRMRRNLMRTMKSAS